MIFLYSGNAVKQVRAQSVGIKFSPVWVEDIFDPGDVKQEVIRVTNQSNVSKTLYIYIRDFAAEGESGTPKLLPPGMGGEYSLAAWIQATTDGIEFGPNEQRSVDITISVPETAGPGGYYGAVIFGTVPPDLKAQGEGRGAAISIAQQTGPLVLIKVRGDIDERAEIREFSTDQEFYGTPFDVNFLIRIENYGNVHIQPRGYVTITNMLNREVGRIPFNVNNTNILPKTIRRYDNTSWQGKNGLGKYKASLGISYGTDVDSGGQGKKSMYAEKTFWIIPWRIIVPVVLGLIFLGSLIVLFLKFYKSKAVKKAMNQMGLGHMRYVEKYYGPSPAMHFGLILIMLLILVFLIVITAYFIFFA